MITFLDVIHRLWRCDPNCIGFYQPDAVLAVILWQKAASPCCHPSHRRIWIHPTLTPYNTMVPWAPPTWVSPQTASRLFTAANILDGANFSRRKKLMWHRPHGSLATGCRRPAVAINDFSWCLKDPCSDSRDFQWVGKPQNCYFPWPWGSGPRLIHYLLGPFESASKRHLDRLSRFFRAQEHD